MGGGKRKHGADNEKYISREETLAKGKKGRNVCNGISLVEASQKIGCQERRFSRKLLLPTDPNCLVALVQMNDICMLLAPEAINAASVSYNIDNVQFSGKKKKGASKVGAGHVLCTVTLPDGGIRELTTPVGGQVLEMNSRLEAHPELLQSDPQGVGYIAVVFPDTELPDFHNFESWKLKERLQCEGKLKAGCCFSWVAGTCTRGSDCKFTHIDLSTASSSSCHDSSIDADVPKKKAKIGVDEGRIGSNLPTTTSST